LFSYLITDPLFYQNFKIDLVNSIEKYQPDYICFRDKNSIKNYKLAIEIAKYYKIPIVVNQYIELVKLGFDGIHLTSSQLNLASQFKQYLTFGSTHNLEEIKKGEGCDFVTFSPIFNSKGREGVGIEKLNQICKIAKPKVFALGGIVSDNEVKQLKNSECYGFASIRYFIRDKES
jgi:thiamine-phosphate pyrophosphorylase